MRILFEGHSLLPPLTGVGRVSSHLIQFLDQHPDIDRITVFLSIFPFGRTWKSSLESLHLLRNTSGKIHFHRIPIPLDLLLKCWNTLKWPSIDSFFSDYDLVMGPAHFLPPRCKTPGILTIHDTSLLEYPEWYPHKALAFRSQILQGIQAADAIIVPSMHVKKKLAGIFKCEPGKVHLVYHPFDGEYMTLNETGKIEVRKEYFGCSEPYLCWIGEINPRKNVGLLFSVLKKLKIRGYDKIKLVLIGNRGYRSDEVFEKAGELNLNVVRWEKKPPAETYDVLVTGFLSELDKKRMLAASGIFVFPSYDEGFGYPVLESMASGIPVVCSQSGSLPEITGNASLVVPPDDVDAYVSHIEKLLNDSTLYDSYIEKGLKRQLEFRQNSQDDLIGVFKKLI